jgi:hypothetical protein
MVKYDYWQRLFNQNMMMLSFISLHRLICLTIFFWALVFHLAQAQDTFKPTIFKYSEKDPSFAVDVGGGLGFSSNGLLAGLSGEIDVYHIYAGATWIYEWQGKYAVTSRSLLLGYRYRTLKYMFSLSSGLTWQKYRCISGENYDCYDYVEEMIHAVPVNATADWILSDNIALGINISYFQSSRETPLGVMLMLKCGAFRE